MVEQDIRRVNLSACLSIHPETEIVFINSSSNAGNKITDVHEGLYGECDLTFTDELPLEDIERTFLLYRPRRYKEIYRKP